MINIKKMVVSMTIYVISSKTPRVTNRYPCFGEDVCRFEETKIIQSKTLK
jgi:hypothetical protein